MLNDTDHAQLRERIERALAAALADVLERPELETEPIKHGARLGDDLGLASLDLAELIAVLELELNTDPFKTLVSITSVRTFGDLRDAYLRSLIGESAPGGDGSLADIAARATARRRGGRGR
jgi:acyl carrier protein